MAKAKAVKVKVTARAIIQRINRSWPPDMRQLCVARGASDLGNYYIVEHNNTVHSHHIELAETARELGVLKGYEEVVT